nr:PspC domain-containing protein [Pediococcus pentosaceus]
MTKKKLTKSSDKIVSGVFGGIAEYFGWDKAIVRIIGAFLIIFPGNIILIPLKVIIPMMEIQ